MKKITLLFVIATLSSLSAFSQFVFPVIPGPTNVLSGSDVTLNLNSIDNTLASVPAGLYTTFSISVYWDNPTGDPYSNEAGLDVITTAGTVTAAIAGDGANGSATTLTFTGAFTSDYNPTVDGFFDIVLSQSYGGSAADWSNITITIFETASCPDPTLSIGNFTAPNLADVTLGAAAGATAYNWEIQPQGTPQGTAGAIDSGVSAVINFSVVNLIDGINYTLYVQSDCSGALGNYLSLNFSYALPPANNDLCNAVALTMDVTGVSGAYTNVQASEEASEPDGTCFSGGTQGSVWFSFVAPASGEVQVSTDIGGSMSDSEIAIYDATGVTCGDLSTLPAELTCDQDSGTIVGAGYMNVLDLTAANSTALTPGTTYYIQVSGYFDARGSFGIQVFDQVTLSIDDLKLSEGFTAYPNPVENELTVSAKSEIKSLSIVNMLGQTVRTVTPNSSVYKLDFSDLNSGIYFVKASVNNNEGTIRIVKK
jgi:hypothetical protein